jgi:diaminohydroxyphosphoribosylaminopyrimidine deaminase/5-amino-6-(5-phosphoribosylamino)uracil reductase
MNALLRKGFGLGGRFDRALTEQVEPSIEFGLNGINPNGMKPNEYWMEQALIESMNGVGITSPNPAVGCVIVQGNHEISRGHTQAYRKEHAEKVAFSRLALSAAGQGVDLSQCRLFVTLEPCSHQGHQPPCVNLLLESSIPEIVIAVRDPDLRVNGAGIRALEEAGKKVTLSVLSAEAKAWNFPFFESKRTGRPVWIAKWAETPSGHLADANGHSKWITGLRSRAYTHWLRQKYDAIVVGARTFLLDQPALTVRDCALPHHRNPERFVFDPKGLTLGLPLERRQGFRFLVCDSVLSQNAGPKAGLNAEPEVIRVPCAPDSPDLWIQLRDALEAYPFDRPLQSVMVEGGAVLIRELFKENVFRGVHHFVGARSFASTDDRYRIQWQPDSSWKTLARQEFDQDVLHEWIKED